MLVNIEFFDEDPIENVITSLHYKIDKTIFFGYTHIMDKRKRDVSRFLKKYCGVKEIEFYELDESNLTVMMSDMSNCLKKEVESGNRLFFDLTGGESLLLVAIGALSKEYKVPMHMYDIRTKEMFEYGIEDVAPLSQCAKYRPVKLNLDGFISLYGGKINYSMHKDAKNLDCLELADDIEKMWRISRKYHRKWLHYSAMLRSFKEATTELIVQADKDAFDREKKKNQAVGTLDYFARFLKECEACGLIRDLRLENSVICFVYKNENIKNYFWDGGSILEMYTFARVKQQYPGEDCRVGVHIDWDGVIHSGGQDVLNEIDVMVMDNNLPIFISCKIGNVNQMALYELETVASQFGGKYVRKILAIGKPLSSGYQLRADEMGIEVWCLK